ncbi:FMN-binding negative transcriptional regulator [Halothiobacillus sp.]|uniref:FMN-binding negative transcriptional regulator n=1 Tax=Halothiobacillus sp. TaxID=1891311 RepID=UPI00261662E2|nr:FMN-binding negative transcriptional regulator [Halothiobacillus sp.]MDD4965736.1 FMN-binding negative transcriptional regulator [Halothiobacillus sp.]
MYVPELYREPDEESLFELIEGYPFGLLVTGTTPLGATHLPFVLEREKKVIRAHLAQANPMVETLRRGEEVLVVFQGPYSYISPHWYATKSHLPTWLYSAVHVYGTPRLLDEEALWEQMVTLIAEQEAACGEASPWRLESMPTELIERLASMVVGVEIRGERWEGCFKLNQHKSAPDMARLEEVLRSSEQSLRHELASLIEICESRTDPAIATAYRRKYGLE